MTASTSDMIPLLTSFRRDAPRFGHSQDVSLLFSQTPGEPYRYALGTITIAAIITGFFLLWAFILVLFIFMGPVKVGFLSGFQMREPKVNLDREGAMKSFKLPRKVQSTFLLASTLVIVCSILLVLEGIQPFLKQSQGKDLLTIATNGENDVNDTIKYFDFLETNTPSYVAEIQPSQLCTFSAAPVDFDRTRNIAIDRLMNFSNNVQTAPYVNLRDRVFKELKSRVNNFESNTSKYGLKSWHGLTFSIPVIIISFLMMIGTILSWAGSTSEWFICILTWALVPILILIVALSVAGSSAASIVLVMNADFCSGTDLQGPEGPIQKILSTYAIPERFPNLYEGFTFVLNRCSGTDPFSFIGTDKYYISDTDSSLRNFEQTLNSTGLAGLSSCNVTSGLFDRIQSETNNFTAISMGLVQSVSSLQISCNSLLRPIYENVVYGDICTQYPRNFVWIFSTLLGISVFGMIMLTLRSSWLTVKYQSDDLPFQSVNTAHGLNHDSASQRDKHRGSPDTSYDHDTLLSDKYERRENVDVPSWDDISVADDAAIREVRRAQDQYAPGVRIY